MTSTRSVLRRMFAPLVFGACLPIVIGAAIAMHVVRSQLDARTQTQMMDDARAFGVALAARLAAADQRLQQLAELPTGIAQHPEPMFQAVTIWRSDAPATVIGERLDAATLIAAAGAALGETAHESTIVVARDASRGAPVLVRRLAPDGTGYALGSLRPGYLWDDRLPSSTESQLCLGDRRNSFRFCSSSDAPAGAVTARWPLFLRPRFGTEPWYVEASSTRAGALAALRSSAAILLGTISVVLGLVLLTCFVWLRALLRPLDRLTSQLDEVARSEPAQCIEVRVDGDFPDLAQSINLASAALDRQSRLVALLGDLDREILSAESFDPVIARLLRAAPGLSASRGAALLLGTSSEYGDGVLYSMAHGDALQCRPCELDLHQLARILDHDVALLVLPTTTLPVELLRDAGFFYARAIAIRDGSQLIGALLLLDPMDARERMGQSAAGVLADRLTLGIAHIRCRQDLQRNVYFDALTGLANREMLSGRIGQALSRGVEERGAAVMLISIDRFKSINETLGHRAGDEVLKLAAERIRVAIGPANTAARLSGDEFMVLMPDLHGPAAAATLADELAASFARPFLSDGVGYVLSLSIGIAIAPDDGRTSDVLTRNADIAMRRAMSRAGGGVVFFEETMNEQAKQRFRLEHGLRTALERNEFELHFQPQIDLRSGRVVAAEALLRWTHPTEGAIVPSVFIPIAEETGLIEPIGYWVIEEACRSLVAWRAAGLPIAQVAVNVSLRQLRSSGFVPEVARIVRDAGLPARSLELEVTESTLAEHVDELPGLLELLRAHGVRIAIDDFGTGYSSLAMLRVLPIDVLKIDRAFVSAMQAGGTGDAIVSAIIAMAHALGKELVAEGVETAEQAQGLEQRGCRIAQGFHFSKALPAQMFLEYCRNHLSRAAQDARGAREAYA